jgi:hypothetical protein
MDSNKIFKRIHEGTPFCFRAAVVRRLNNTEWTSRIYTIGQYMFVGCC